MRRMGGGIAGALLALAAGPSVAAQSGQDPTGPYPPNSVPYSIEIETFDVFCVDDTPFVRYELSANGFTPGSEEIELRLYDADGDELPAPYSPMGLDSFTGQFLYPGATAATLDWPGWEERPSRSNNWVEDPSDARWRDGLSIVVTYLEAPSAVPGFQAPPDGFRSTPRALLAQQGDPLVAYADIEYPPATEVCYGPPSVSRPPAQQAPPDAEADTPVGELPSTGGGFGLFRQAVALVLAGALLVLVATRRRQHEPNSAV